MASGVCFGFYSSLFTSAIAILLLAFIGVCTAEVASPSTTLELHMIRYSNPSENDYGGSCCDAFCNDCDHKFRFSLDRGNSDNNPNPQDSYYWSKTTGEFEGQNTVTFGSNMNGVSNPIVTNFPISWPSVGVKLKVFVVDVDYNSHDDVDGFVQLLTPSPARNASTASWTTITMNGLRPRFKTTLRLKYKLYCNANYYLSDCSVFCTARDSDMDGHYTCDPATGNKVCRPGWEDGGRYPPCNTSTNDCLGHRCRNGATCVDGDHSYTCRCPPGYTGRYCEVNIDECASQPCLNGGTCTDQVASYRCTCPPFFTGPTCATKHCIADY